jgi:hypothetical protein
MTILLMSLLILLCLLRQLPSFAANQHTSATSFCFCPLLARVQVVVVVSLFGTNVAQIVASASDAYYLEEGNSLDKR